MNRTLVESARDMLNHATIRLEFWADAVFHVAHPRNLPLEPNDAEKIPYEKPTGGKPRIDYLRVLGSKSWVHLPIQKWKIWVKRALLERLLAAIRTVHTRSCFGGTNIQWWLSMWSSTKILFTLSSDKKWVLSFNGKLRPTWRHLWMKTVEMPSLNVKLMKFSRSKFNIKFFPRINRLTANKVMEEIILWRTCRRSRLRLVNMVRKVLATKPLKRNLKFFLTQKVREVHLTSPMQALLWLLVSTWIHWHKKKQWRGTTKKNGWNPFKMRSITSRTTTPLSKSNNHQGISRSQHDSCSKPRATVMEACHGKKRGFW